MVKLIDIAKFLGLSVTTVSYSLNDDPRIPAATKQRVIEAARKLGYAGKSGRFADKDYLRQVVLCINSLGGEIYSDIVYTMEKSLALNNCELMIYLGTEITKLKWLDGLFVLNPKISGDDIAKIAARRIPVVLMDRDEHPDNVNVVTLDNFNGCYNTTSAAVNAGARTFAFIGGPKESFESRYRYEGFSKALADNGLQHRGILVLQTDFTYEGGITACRFLLENGNLPDAIVCANDETALGIIAGLKAGGVTKNIIVTGFDGVKPAETFPVRYITARVDHKHWATTSVYSLIHTIEHEEHQNIKIPVQTVEYNL